MSAIRHLWTHHRLVFIAFLGACLVTLGFLVRLTVFTLYWADPSHSDLAPEPWMTPGYIAHSWGLPPEDLARALGVTPGSRPTLQEIARERGVPVEAIINEIKALLPARPSE
ncbi:hypothetical protein [Marimonas lutisalis]|uniref:hypothetical protein n=1 Tax=Marimonas lutisalis TaxID=2545756 RepID=UPI0010FA0809|nr:hypothetical protein [Marimonas lutisalis]